MGWATADGFEIDSIVINAVSAPPSASFTQDKTSGSTPFTVQFTDTSSNNPSSWLWDFGDGSTSTAQNPSHQFVGGGTYNVTLTATNSFGSNQTSPTTITVNAVPVASFTFSQNGMTISFTDTSSHSPTSWSWDFGDGATSTVKNPTHTFSTVRTFNVTLTATNSVGSSNPCSIPVMGQFKPYNIVVKRTVIDACWRCDTNIDGWADLPDWETVIQDMQDYTGTPQRVFYGFLPYAKHNLVPAENKTLLSAYSFDYLLTKNPVPRFAPSDVTGVTWRGEYSPTTAYVAGDGVIFGGSYYVCTEAGTGQTPPQNIWKQIYSSWCWSPLPPNVIWQGTYSAGHYYNIGDGVVYSGTNYQCIQAGAGHIGDNAYWSSMTVLDPNTLIESLMDSLTFGGQPIFTCMTNETCPGWGTTIPYQQFTAQEQTTMWDFIGKIENATKMMMVVKWDDVGGAWKPTWYWISEDNIDISLGLPAEVIFNSGSTPWLDAEKGIDITQRPDDSYTGVITRGTDVNGNFYEKISTLAADAYPVYYIDPANPAYNTQALVDARNTELCNFLLNTPFVYQMEMIGLLPPLYQKIDIQGFNVNGPQGSESILIGGPFRIIGITYQMQVTEKDIDVRSIIQFATADYLSKKRLLTPLLADSAVTAITGAINQTIAAQPQPKIATVSTVSGNSVTTTSPDGTTTNGQAL